MWLQQWLQHLLPLTLRCSLRWLRQLLLQRRPMPKCLV